MSANFTILAGGGITNTAPTTVIGDIGSYPTPTQTGFGPGADAVTITGTNHTDDGATQSAKTDLVTAYNTLQGQSSDHTISADLGGQTLVPGVYRSGSTIGLSGTVTLNGGGDPDAVFIFQAGSSLTTLSGSQVVLTNGTQPCNVFWQVGSDATLGTGSTFRGIVIAQSSITVTTNATVYGRILARDGAVTLDTDTITAPGCSAPVSHSNLHVVKVVINSSHTGTATSSDFRLYVKDSSGNNVTGSPANGAPLPGTLYSLPLGTYTVSEDANASYTQNFFGSDCDSNGKVTLSGADKTCTIINTDIPALGAVTSAVSTSVSGASSMSGGSGRSVPLIGILKVPTPLALPAGPGSVTYNYKVWNIARQKALADVTVVDDKCTPVKLLSGDSNNDNKLDLSEEWNYSCTTTIATTTTNTAVATGYSDDPYHQIAVATSIATVVVNATTTPPLINITKVPSQLTPFAYGGGNVTYTYTVTNPGVVPLSQVAVTDDKCYPVSLFSGDANQNGLLDLGESWIYTCQSAISVSTRNMATASGRANGLTATGYAFATVLVAIPGLPNTGFSPQDTAR